MINPFKAVREFGQQHECRDFIESKTVGVEERPLGHRMVAYDQLLCADCGKIHLRERYNPDHPKGRTVILATPWHEKAKPAGLTPRTQDQQNEWLSFYQQYIGAGYTVTQAIHYLNGNFRTKLSGFNDLMQIEEPEDTCNICSRFEAANS